MLYLAALLFVIVFTIIPILLGQILQDRFNVIKRGFVPVYAIGFFFMIAMHQALMMLITLKATSLAVIQISNLVFLIITIIAIVINRKHWYRSEWKVTIKSFAFLIPVGILYLVLMYVVPWVPNNLFNTGWSFDYLTIQANPEFSTTEHFSGIFHALSTIFDISRTDLIIHALPIPIILLMGNIFWFVAKPLFNIKKSFLFWITTLLVFVSMVFTHQIFHPFFIATMSYIFVFGLFVHRQRLGDDHIFILVLASMALTSAFAFNDITISTTLSIIGGYFIYIMFSDDIYKLKHWTAASLLPMITFTFYLFGKNRLDGAIMFIIMTLVYGWVIYKLFNEYSDINKLETIIAENAKKFVFIGLLLVGIVEFSVSHFNGLGFKYQSMILTEQQDNFTVFAQLTIFALSFIWCIIYWISKSIHNPSSALFTSIIFVIVILLSPLIHNFIIVSSGIKLTNELYVTLCLLLSFNIIYMLGKREFIREIAATILPFVVVVGVYGYLYIKVGGR